MSSSPVMALPQVSAEQAGYWTAFPMSSPTVMDSVCSSKVKGGAAADNASVKVRKPYTITKQRERWTEDEHQKFLEALKLHGRAWRRIEEHIGTKTAVQIRSHAQKFFCKLEREASLTGSSGTIGSGEIAIPPPRPKRKPTHPYPKKASGAFSSSPSFEDETKSPPAVHSAFTPLESNMHTSWPKGPPKETNASLRLFGQTVIPCGDMVGADAHQTEVSHSVLMESTGSPRSQLSGEVEQPSEVPLSCTSSDVWNTCASFSRLKESTGTVSSDRQPPACDKAPADLHISSLKESPMFALGSKFPDTQGGIQSWQPPSFSLTEHHVASIPAFWQGLVPSSFPHGYGTQDDVNAAAAFAAVSYAMASAWQAAIQGAMASVSNETNTGIVYSPVAILPAARKPQSPDGHADERSKDKLKDYSTDCNDTNGTSLQGEDSTAECCSTITDTSRASCYESNDEGRPAKKHHRQSGKDTSVASNSHDGKPSSLFLIHEGSQFEISTRSSDNSIGEATRPTTVQGKASGVELHVESPLCNENLVSGRAMKQPLDLIVQACELQSFMEIDEAKEPTKGGGGGGIGHVSNKESMLLSAASTMPGSADSSKGSVQMGKRHGLDDGDRLATMKAGSALSARYSGVGFVPYKRSNSFESSNKPED